MDKQHNILGVFCKRTVISLLFLLMPVCISYSQQYLVHHYSETDGLSSSNVYDSAQDQWGRMWFATRAGITCYDGVSWQSYSVADGLPSKTYRFIAADPRGWIWALSHFTSGKFYLVVFNGKEWQSMDSFEVSGLSTDMMSSFSLSLKNETLTVFLTTSKGLHVWKNGKYRHMTTADGLLSSKLNGGTVIGETFYAGTDKGISLIDNDSLAVDNRLNSKLSLPTQNIRAVAFEDKTRFPLPLLKDSKIWLLGDTWLGYLEGMQLKYKKLPDSLAIALPDAPAWMIPDYRGGVFAGNRLKMAYYNYINSTWSFIGVHNGLFGDRAYGMLLDYEKNIWMTHDRGVDKIAGRRFINFQKNSGMLEDEVTAITQIGVGKIVLGHKNGVTFVSKQSFSTLSFEKELGPYAGMSRVLDIKADSKQNIWLALSFGGLAKIDKNKHFTWYGHKLYAKAKGNARVINSLVVDDKDRLWLAGESGIVLVDKNKNVPVFKKPGSRNSGIRKIFALGKEFIFAATYGEGVYALTRQAGEDGRQWINFRINKASNANNVFAVSPFKKNLLLVGTLGGLYQLDLQSRRMQKFKKEFEINRPIYFIKKVPEGEYWFGTDNGVYYWQVKNKRLLHYSTAEGMIGQETNRAACIRDDLGRMWIGTNRGLSVYNRQFDDSSSWNPKPKLRFINIETNLRQFPFKMPDAVAAPEYANTRIRLDSMTHTITFHLRGISFRDEKSMRFSYWLEGFDKQWLEEQYPYKQMVRYSNLQAGEYRFHVKVRSVSGVWSDTLHSPPLLIGLPFYKQWWFYLLLIIGFAFVMFGITRYYSERKHAGLLEKQVEERTNQLQSVEKRYRKLFEESKDGVFIISPEGKPLDINPAGLELFGLHDRREVEQSGLAPNIRDNPEEWWRFRQAIEKSGFVKDFQLKLNSAEGGEVIALVTATVVRGKSGKTSAYRGLIRDISRQKQLEQQLIQAQKMESIGTLAGGIAHDFNNILGVINGYAELVIEDLEKGTLIQQNARHILTAARRASELVKQILAFSRQEESKRVPMEIVPIVTETLKLLRSTLPATIKIKSSYRIDSAVILAEPTRIHQVLMNLCSNSAHAMQDSGGLLEIELDTVHLDLEASARHNIKQGPYLRITVSDTGCGIPKVVMKRIFDPYFTTKNTGEGTGMGLAVVHGIVKGYDGDISVLSQPGRGTTFQIFLPVVEKGGTAKSGKISRDIPMGKGERILLIDDETVLAEMGSQVLKRLGYSVKGLADPRQALNLFRQNPESFDLVITDLTMPHITGLQVAREVKQIKPDIPVILCSGFSAGASREEIRGQVDDFVMKPIIRSNLADTVRTVLDRNIIKDRDND